MGKFVKSTKTLNEHIDSIWAVRDLKNKGYNDKMICKQLVIGNNKLIQYKQILREFEQQFLEKFSDIAYKKYEIDEQIQFVIFKLNSMLDIIENEYKYFKELAEKDQTSDKAKFSKLAKFPVSDAVEIKKAILQAINLRIKIWGLDQKSSDTVRNTDNRRVMILQVNNKLNNLDNNTEAKKIEKLNKIADSIISDITGGKNGMQLQEGDT